MKGYKTYLVSLATLAWAVYGMVSGHLAPEAATQLIQTSLLAITIRHGITSETAK